MKTITLTVEIPDGVDVDIFQLRCREAMARIAHGMAGHCVPRASGLGYVRGDRERHERMQQLLAGGFAASLAAAAWEVADDACGLRTRLGTAKRLIRSWPLPCGGGEPDVAAQLAELARIRSLAVRTTSAGTRGKDRLFALAREAEKLERYIHGR